MAEGTGPVLERLNAALEDRYRLLEQIGEGGMATVFLAEDLKHERQVALKVLKPDLAAMVGSERFLAEIKTTANLQHPHILPLYDSGEADSFLYYVMPYVQGATLADRLRTEHQLPVDEAVSIAAAVAHALDFAHRQGVVHRDIKPANVLFQDGQPVVSDFGIALAVGAGSAGRLTETGLSLGTPYYMSPEQATGDQAVGPRSDIYSLGCVLYEMLTGDPPYIGSTAQAVLGKIITAEPLLPTEHRSSVPPHVEAAALRALEKLPADRFGSAGEFAAALEDRTLTHTRQAAASGAGSAGGRAPWISQRASQVAVAAVVLLGLWSGFSRLSPGPDPAPRPVTRVVLDQPIGMYQFALSDDGRWLASRPGPDGPLRLRRMDQEGYRELDLGGFAVAMDFSPDGRWLLVVRGDDLMRVPVDGGAPIPITSSNSIFSADWGEDDRIVYVDPDGIYVVSANGGDPEQVLAGEFASVWDARWLPGGDRILYVSGNIGNPRGEIRVLELETGESRVIIEDGFAPRITGGGPLFFLRADQALFAVRFDARRAEPLGQPNQVLDSVVTNSNAPTGLYAVSDAGTLVYPRGGPIGDGDQEDRIVFVDGSGAEELTPVPAGQLDFPRLSPDGRRLAYNRGNRVYVYDLLTGLNTPLTPADKLSWGPTWSRDGTRIAVFSLGEGGAFAEVFSPDDPGPATVVPSAEAAVVIPLGWLPNDEGLLVNIGDNSLSKADLSIVEFGADTTMAPYLRADWREVAGALSPDGRWVVYESNESGEERLYVRSFPEPGRRHDISPAGMPVSGTPVWARDASAIYWRSGDSLMVADVTLEPGFSASRPRPLFVGDYDPEFDVTDDGRFIMIKPARSDTTEAGRAEDEDGRESRTILVVNWLEEVKERMGGGGR